MCERLPPALERSQPCHVSIEYFPTSKQWQCVAHSNIVNRKIRAVFVNHIRENLNKCSIRGSGRETPEHYDFDCCIGTNFFLFCISQSIPSGWVPKRQILISLVTLSHGQPRRISVHPEVAEENAFDLRTLAFLLKQFPQLIQPSKPLEAPIRRVVGNNTVHLTAEPYNSRSATSPDLRRWTIRDSSSSRWPCASPTPHGPQHKLPPSRQ